ncbi:hypothetical protein BH11GEM1_BH11GEM1_06030 [soil metagenome]
MKLLTAAALLASTASAALAQPRAVTSTEFAPRTMSLATLNGFRPTSPNWKIAGGATASRTRALALAALAGNGTVVNSPAPGASGPLFTGWEHGDLDLSFDVMLPRGARSAVYLMGRYAVLLADSWATHTPTSASLGAIARPMSDTRAPGQSGFEGTPPRQLVSRAPGLWQHVEILFRAPEFSGPQKIANALFAKVTVNGVVVHANVEAPGPTDGAAFNDERATGPLMFPGDHGPLAVRNIQYKAYSGSVVLSALRYRAFEGDTMDASYVATHAPIREGNAAAVAEDVGGAADKFARAYDGTMAVPTTGAYRFQLDIPWIGNDSATRGSRVGGGTLTIDGAPVLVHAGAQRRATADATLTAGTHSFALTYYKNRAGNNRRDIALWVEGPGVERQALYDESAANAGGSPVNPILVEPQLVPVVLRSFLRHGITKRVVAVSVADPQGVHYSYDLAQGALLSAWRGPFLETTQMWHERSEDQLAEPLGSALMLAGSPSLAFLEGANAAWPDSVDERQFRRDGYALDASGHPTFLSHLRDIAVEDAVRPADHGMALRRTLHLRAAAAAVTPVGLYLQVAQGDHITRDPDGAYVVGDRGYYVTVPGGQAAAVVRRLNGHDALLVPVRFNRGAADVAYTIVW